MSTVNMKKVGDVYEQDFDPFSEYSHQPNKVEFNTREVTPIKHVEVSMQPNKHEAARNKMNKVIDGIDEAIEGVELIFEFGNKLAERFRRF